MLEFLRGRAGEMYALKDYIGEERLNAALRKCLDGVKFQEAPYTVNIGQYQVATAPCTVPAPRSRRERFI